MIRIIFLFLLMAYSTVNVCGQSIDLASDIAGMEMSMVGNEGEAVVKVWCFSKKPQVAENDILRYAVWGACFIGAQPNVRVNGFKPLVEQGINEDNDDYFKRFFDTDYSQYARLGMDGYAEAGDIIRIKKRYKIGRIVVIHLTKLRQRLEADNIIKPLDFLF